VPKEQKIWYDQMAKANNLRVFQPSNGSGHTIALAQVNVPYEKNPSSAGNFDNFNQSAD
jgi:hypothetical protein